MAQSWEVVRKEARRLETDIESKLVEYSKLASSLHSSRSTALDARTSTDGMQRRNTSTKDCAQMTNEMEQVLKQLSQTIQTMRDMVQQQSKTKISSTSSHTLQRHTEILRDYTQEFKKTTSMIGAHREHAELLQGGSRYGSFQWNESERRSGSTASHVREYGGKNGKYV
ncbi:unnamed protein product [Agarophyton chilense]